MDVRMLVDFYAIIRDAQCLMNGKTMDVTKCDGVAVQLYASVQKFVEPLPEDAPKPPEPKPIMGMIDTYA
jgi:hypothetical protein